MYDSFPAGEYNIRSSTPVDVMAGVEDIVSFYNSNNVGGDGNNVAGVPPNLDNVMNENEKTMPPPGKPADNVNGLLPELSSSLPDSSMQGDDMETSYPRESESGSETTRGSQEEAIRPLHSDLPPTTDADPGDTNLPASSSPTLPVLPDGSGAIVGASDSVLVMVNNSAEALEHRAHEQANSSPLESTSAVEEEKDSDQANNNPAKSTTVGEEQKDSDEDFTTPPPSTQSRSNVKVIL
ncbi:predicted protein [Arabidopsis lyrata subsp. lyrata]|uniref:Predicted protein n=1 Tax=Arabidopsis lyrata subsp. lyrata TaxID=81972 RepID=D7MIG1_ARALL|nr:predicted protein [Arabidopsis lyrata subsp. lyrata]